MQKKIFILSLLFVLTMLIGCVSKTNVSTKKETDMNDTTIIEDITTISQTATEEDIEPEIEYVDLFVNNKIKEINPSESDPHIVLEKDTFNSGDQISIASYNCGSSDWIGLYPYGGYPQDMNAIVWTYADNTQAVTLQAKMYKNETRYLLFLCQNDGYTVLDCKEITITDGKDKDYGAKEASCEIKDGEITVSITPAISRSLSYEIYWARNGKRLSGYTYLKAFTYASSGSFTYSLGNYILMPDKANQIEVHVVNGKSTSIFLDVDDTLKIGESNYLYSFNVLTDLHLQDYTNKPNHVEHLQTALNDIYNYNPNTKAIFNVGDQTDTGQARDYNCLKSIFDIYQGATGVPVYYTLGNHEYMYANTFDQQISTFKKLVGKTTSYYTVEVEGSTCIFLASEVQSTGGGMSDEQVSWLKQQLENADKTKPIYIFLHQPLIDTVSGSYEEQGWYGIENVGRELEKILENYKNTFLFSGHTHWEMESKNNIHVSLTGTTYINCASVGYLWNDDYAGEPGSEGYFIDVYDDCLVVRGREFTKNEWIAYATYKIPFAK